MKSVSADDAVSSPLNRTCSAPALTPARSSTSFKRTPVQRHFPSRHWPLTSGHARTEEAREFPEH